MDLLLAGAENVLLLTLHHRLLTAGGEGDVGALVDSARPADLSLLHPAGPGVGHHCGGGVLVATVRVLPDGAVHEGDLQLHQDSGGVTLLPGHVPAGLVPAST